MNKSTDENSKLKLMCILAHPDDESLGAGGLLAKYASEGVETYLVTATRGERGWAGPPDENPGMENLGRMREAELRAAAAILGVQQVALLDYIDGDLDQAEPKEATACIVRYIREWRPHVVVTFGPDGAYGHPDHVAICQLTTAAVLCAADPDYECGHGRAPHRVSKLYYRASSRQLSAAYQSVFGEFEMHVDGVGRRLVSWEDWAITTWVDATDYWRPAWEAVACHKTQLPNYAALTGLSEEEHKVLWGLQTFYRAFSLVNGGREIEHDLFEGLR